LLKSQQILSTRLGVQRELHPIPGYALQAALKRIQVGNEGFGTSHILG
jgi:hypothetical protein